MNVNQSSLSLLKNPQLLSIFSRNFPPVFWLLMLCIGSNIYSCRRNASKIWIISLTKCICNIPLKIFTAPSNHGIYDHLSSYKYSMNMYLQYGSHGYNWFIVNNDEPKLHDAIVLENKMGNNETRKYRHNSHKPLENHIGFCCYEFK